MQYDLSTMAGFPLNLSVSGVSGVSGTAAGLAGMPGTVAVTGAQTPWSTMIGPLKQFVSDSLPLMAVAHSYLVDALSDPALRADPAFERFSLSAVNALHHEVAMLGSLLRMEEGDPTALAALGRDIVGLMANREEAARMTQAIAPAMLAHPALQSVVEIAREANRHLAENWHTLSGALSLAGIPTPASVSVTAIRV